MLFNQLSGQLYVVRLGMRAMEWIANEKGQVVASTPRRWACAP